MNHEVKGAINKKKSSWRDYCSVKSRWNFIKFKNAWNFCTNKIRDTKRKFECKIAKEAKTDPKSFWKYVKWQTKYKETIPTLRNAAGLEFNILLHLIIFSK